MYERYQGFERLASEVRIIQQGNEARDATIAELRQDVKELLALANQGKGGFWAGMAIASALGTVGGWMASHFTTR